MVQACVQCTSQVTYVNLTNSKKSHCKFLHVDCCAASSVSSVQCPRNMCALCLVCRSVYYLLPTHKAICGLYKCTCAKRKVPNDSQDTNHTRRGRRTIPKSPIVVAERKSTNDSQDASHSNSCWQQLNSFNNIYFTLLRAGTCGRACSYLPYEKRSSSDYYFCNLKLEGFQREFLWLRVRLKLLCSSCHQGVYACLDVARIFRLRKWACS